MPYQKANTGGTYTPSHIPDLTTVASNRGTPVQSESEARTDRVPTQSTEADRAINDDDADRGPRAGPHRRLVPREGQGRASRRGGTSICRECSCTGAYRISLTLTLCPQPSAHHNLGACLEDAVTLGELFGRLRRRSQVPAVLAAYEDIRQPRCAMLAETERRTITFVSLANGPARDTRDAGLRAALAAAKEDWDDAEEVLLQRTWGNFIRPFDYNAREATQEWWNLWGSLLEKGQGRRHATVDEEDRVSMSPVSPVVRVEMTRYSISQKCCMLDERP